MKKVLALILVLVLALSLAACTTGNNGENGGETGGTTSGETGGMDMSKYPADINEWTAQNFNDYFKEVGVYTNDEYIYMQDHATYYSGTAVDECGGYMDNEGLYFTGVFIVDPDSQEADGKAMLENLRSTKTFPEELGSIPVDHLVGNVVFFYSFSADEAFYNAFDAAYNQLIKDLGVTPDF